MAILRVESIEDPRVADYRYTRDGDLLRERGLFIVEGRGNLRRLVLESSHRPRSVFVSEPAAAGLGPVLAALEPGVETFVATRALLSKIVGFDIHRGCLAACDRPTPADPIALLPRGDSPSVVVVLERLTDPDNVGAVFRNAMAFGVDAVLSCPHTCDSLYRKAIRVSMGAALCMPSARFERWPEGLLALRDAGYQIVVLHPGEGAVPLAELDPLPERLALVLGSEGMGLSDAVLDAADLRLRIPMAAGFDSLNVATASGIALQHVFSRTRKRPVGRVS